MLNQHRVCHRAEKLNPYPWAFDMATLTMIKWEAPQTAVESYPDSKRYKGGFGVHSESSDAIHKISFDTATMCWTCSCRGNIRWGQCKHLSSLALRGRKFGRNLAEGRKYGWLPYQSGSMAL